MKLLFCSQFYTPSVGGVQELMRQLAEAMVTQGHEVVMATSSDSNRNFDSLNGVVIQEFEVAGNNASGLIGEVDAYQRAVLEGGFDLLVVMAAQQWTFDALWPILGELEQTKKVFIPCGFSGFYDPLFAQYFEQMPRIMGEFDHLIFHSSKYRDIDLAREHGMHHFSIIPCGASANEFEVECDPEFRQRNGIPEEDFLFLTVGSFTGIKGHREIIAAFERMALPKGKSATLILNGNKIATFGHGAGGFAQKVLRVLRDRGLMFLARTAIQRMLKARNSIDQAVVRINAVSNAKRVLVTNFARPELIQAFRHADLFVFASNIEYSPLVLFETAAAGTPFLSVDVGNSPEIANWTGAGIICPSWVDDAGYTQVDATVLAQRMSDLMAEPQSLIEMGAAGRETWRQELTWDVIAKRYERVFHDLCTQGEKEGHS